MKRISRIRPLRGLATFVGLWGANGERKPTLQLIPLDSRSQLGAAKRIREIRFIR
jgi:hypothetical protein